MSSPSSANSTNTTPKVGPATAIKRILNGEFLSSEEMMGQIPFLVFVVFLFLCNIAWVYSFENTERNLQITVRELEQKQAEYNTTINQLETKKRQSNVAADMISLGLKVPTSPPFIIEADKDLLEAE